MARLEDLIMQGTRTNQPAAGVAGRLYFVTDENNALERDNGTTWDQFIAETSPPKYPIRATIWADELLKTNGAADIYYLHSQDAYYHTRQSPGTNGDVWTTSFMLAAGTYTLYTLGFTNSNEGKLDYSIDGVSAISGQDWYSAGATYMVIKSGSVTVVGNGRHKLQMTVNGKNGSSSSYYMQLIKFWIVPSSDTSDV